MAGPCKHCKISTEEMLELLERVNKLADYAERTGLRDKKTHTMDPKYILEVLRAFDQLLESEKPIWAETLVRLQSLEGLLVELNKAGNTKGLLRGVEPGDMEDEEPELPHGKTGTYN